ncbi:hypothetical protein SPONL_940 [uncultured Candidatus Thioglobus sp.]|nr:hypothetical protein SPONL_940 [uncultured Candidatus Thioglobus sp.]
MSIFQSVNNIKRAIKYDELFEKSRKTVRNLNRVDYMNNDIINPNGMGSVEFLKSITLDDNFNNLDSNELATAAANIKLQCRI